MQHEVYPFLLSNDLSRRKTVKTRFRCVPFPFLNSLSRCYPVAEIAQVIGEQIHHGNMVHDCVGDPNLRFIDNLQSMYRHVRDFYCCSSTIRGHASESDALSIKSAR